MTSNYNADDLLDLIADLEVLKDMAEGRGYVEPDEQIGGTDKTQGRTWASIAGFLAGSLRIAKKLQADLEAPTFTVPEGRLRRTVEIALDRLTHGRETSWVDETVGMLREALAAEPRQRGSVPTLRVSDPARSPTQIRPEAIRAASACGGGSGELSFDQVAAKIDAEIGPALNGAQESLDRIFVTAGGEIKAGRNSAAIKEIHEEALAALGALNEV